MGLLLRLLGANSPNSRNWVYTCENVYLLERGRELERNGKRRFHNRHFGEVSRVLPSFLVIKSIAILFPASTYTPFVTSPILYMRILLVLLLMYLLSYSRSLKSHLAQSGSPRDVAPHLQSNNWPIWKLLKICHVHALALSPRTPLIRQQRPNSFTHLFLWRQFWSSQGWVPVRVSMTLVNRQALAPTHVFNV